MNNWKLQIKSDKSDSAVVTKLIAIIPHCSQKMWVLISVGFKNTGKAGSKTNTLTESTANFVGNLGWVSAIPHTDMIRTLQKCNCRKKKKTDIWLSSECQDELKKTINGDNTSYNGKMKHGLVW